jgi:hypothetical protein
MDRFIRSTLLLFVLGVLSSQTGAALTIARVRNVTRSKIIESTKVDLRPGSIYDDITYFESRSGWRPRFAYEFLDVGLGTAEPLYPIYQVGHQGSWLQLLAAGLNQSNRHIDHYSRLTTPEGCLVDSIYMLRNIHEFPHRYQKEKDEGYTQIVIRLEYYTQLRPGAQAGRHRSFPPDPHFDPVAFMHAHLNAGALADFPQDQIWKFEAEVSALRQFSEELNNPSWPRFKTADLRQNSLWYYPNGFAEDYGVNTPHALGDLKNLKTAKDLVVQGSPQLQQAFPLTRLLKAAEFGKLLTFLSGKPTPNFDPHTEPGADTLDIHNVTTNNVYTRGLHREPIRDVMGDVSDPAHYALVGMTIKPFDAAHDVSFPDLEIIPQIRLVYQLMDPRNPGQPFEQLYLHLNYDVVDRLAAANARNAQHAYFLRRVDDLAACKQSAPDNYGGELVNFINEFTQRGVEEAGFSSSLTGLWIFGFLSTSYDVSRELRPVRIIREGVDVGYYSSFYDNDLFRAELKKAQGDHQHRLQQILDDQLLTTYRDPKRMDVHAFGFNRMTCAQCHQTSGRDEIQFSLNDGIDRRFKAFARPSEFIFHEADRQLQLGATLAPEILKH